MAAKGSLRWATWLPILLVACAVVFNLWTLRAERLPVSQPNDGALHTQMIRWAGDRIAEGDSPLDGWYPYFALGSAQFHHYPSLPHVLLGGLTRVADAQALYSMSVYLLLSLWPLAVYYGARGFGWDRWGAACAAAIAPLLASAPGYGFEYDSYTWRGLGLFSQLCGMLVMPFAWRAGWQALERGGRWLAWGAGAVALAIAMNYLLGYLTLVCVLVWMLIQRAASRADLPRAAAVRVARGIAVVGGATLAAAWVLVPLLADVEWTNLSPEFAGEFWNDSFGAGKVFSWLASGELFDAGRIPVISVLAVVGLVTALWPGQDRRGALAIAGAGLVSLVLFSGRSAFGPLIDLLPGARDLMLHRFVTGVHLAGIMLAGYGLAAVGRWVYSRAATLRGGRYLAPVLVGVMGAMLLLPGAIERASFHAQGGQWIAQQRIADEIDGRDLDALLAGADAGDGRYYAGSRVGEMGSAYRIGNVSVYSKMADHDLDAVGFTYRTLSSLSSDVEASFNDTDPVHYDLFDVRYMVLPASSPPLVDASLVATEGQHSLWSVPTSGFMSVIDTAGTISADRATIGIRARELLLDPGLRADVLPTVSFAGATPGPSTAPPDDESPPGAVLQAVAIPEEGHFVAAVRAERRAVLLLKTSFHPRWTATIDGDATDVFMVAPSFMGVEVPTGEHSIEFRYVPFDNYWILFLIGALTLVVLWLAPELARLALGGFRRLGSRPAVLRR